jgi:uncharacterized protein (TIGR04255 family)
MRSGIISGITTSMSTSEVWPNAPLALVAIEAKFPSASAALVRVPAQRAVRDLLGGDWVLENAKEQSLEVGFGPAGVQTPNVRVENLTRITVRDRTQVVTLRPESLSIEATRYDGYQAFRDLLEQVFSAVERVLEPDGLTRLGLRYIDEIRVPDLVAVDEWADWVDPTLLAPVAEGLSRLGWSNAAQYETGTERRLVLRYGPAGGAVVEPGGPLKRPFAPKPGPVFVMDFDSFWQPSDIPAFLTENLLTACDELRQPARAMFDQLITQRLIDDVFKKEPAT